MSDIPVSGNNFTSLNDAINIAESGDTINLNNDIVKSEDEFSSFYDGIVIDKNLTINGNGYSIDANHNGRIFNINVDNVILTLNDITLTNANYDDYGGAIYVNGGVTIAGSNISFVNNTAYAAGVISGSDVTISGSDVCFVNNTASYGGGAIHNDGMMIINGDNVCFVNNTSQDYGGAIHVNAGMMIINGDNVCFVNNTAQDGGAIYVNGGVTIAGSNISFVNNTATRGGAIHGDVVIDGDNICFVNNTATSDGGAIGASVTINGDNVCFVNNTAQDGGAIHGDVVIDGDNVCFVNNTATSGGAIYISSVDDGFVLDNVCFVNNTATSSGGAIYINNYFIYSDNDNYGNGLLEFDFVNVSFVNNSAVNGGALYINPQFVLLFDGSDSDVYVWGFVFGGKDVCFVNNTASYGGAIGINTLIGDAQTSQSSTVDYTVRLSGMTFDGNVAGVSGGAVYLNQSAVNMSYSPVDIPDNFNSEYKFYNLNFKGNVAVNGSAVYNNNCYVSIVDSSVFGNNASYAAAVYNNGTIVIKNTSFADNVALRGAGIVNIGDMSLSDSVFFNNTASYAGGAVINTGLLNINGTGFNNNTADLAGGAVINLNGTLNVVDSSFTQNSAVLSAGAIANMANLYLEDSYFFNNGASRGGAIFNDDNLTVVNTTFQANRGNGSAIYNARTNYTDGEFTVISNGNIIIMDSLFIGLDLVVNDATLRLSNNTVVSDYFVRNLNNASIEGLVFNLSYPDMIYIGEDVIFGLNVTDDNGNPIKHENGVTVNIDGTVFVVTSDSHFYSFGYAFNEIGRNLLTVNVPGSSNTTILRVFERDTEINVTLDKEEYVYGDDVIVTVDLNDNITGTVFISVGDYSTSISVENGHGSTVISGLGAGSYRLVADYNGITSAADFVVDKADLDFGASVDDIVYGEVAVLNITTMDNVFFIVTVDGSSSYVYGNSSVNLYNLGAGEYSVIVAFSGDDNYNSASISLNFTVGKAIPDVSVNVPASGDDYVVLTTIFDSSVTGNITLIVDDGEIISSRVVNGIQVFFVYDLLPGNHSALISYSGDDNYRSYNTAFNFTVEGSSIVLDAEDIALYYRNGTNFTAGVYELGTAVVDVPVIFEVNGVNYTRYTNNDGVASLAINLNPGEYVVTAYYGNQSVTRIVTVLPTVVIEDLTKYYRNDSRFEIRVLDGHGNPLANANVSININGVFYYRTTDSDGMAYLNINLNPGTYTVTVQDLGSGLMMSSTVTVLPTLVGEDVVMDYRDGSQYSVAVVDKQGNPVVNQTVIMNINGVFYNRSTDEDGIARLNINLLPGEYIITSEYDEYRVSNTITVNRV